MAQGNKMKGLTLVGKRANNENRAKPESFIVKRAMAANYIADMATGMTQKGVALKYQVSLESVRDLLRWAEKENFFDKARDAIDNRLVPLAIDLMEHNLKNAIRKAVENGDSDSWEMAERMLKGVALLGGVPRGQAANESDNKGEFDEYSYERWVAKRSSTDPPTIASGSVERDSTGDRAAIDAEIILETSSEASETNPSGETRSEVDAETASAGGEDGQAERS